MTTVDAFRWDPEFDDADTGAFTLPSTPVSAGEVAGMVPTVVPIRKPFRDEPPLFWVALCAGLVAGGFVAVWGMLAVGGYLGGAS